MRGRVHHNGKTLPTNKRRSSSAGSRYLDYYSIKVFIIFLGRVTVSILRELDIFKVI